MALSTGSVSAATLDEARSLYAEGRIAESAAAFRDAAEALESDDPETAAGARNNACVLWRSLGELDRAEEDCRHALRLRSDDASDGQARTYNNLGLVLQRRAAYAAAREVFERALAINEQLELPSSRAIVLSNLGINATQAGWYADAIDAFDELGRLVDAHAGEPWASRQRELARINLAVVHERLGAYREALRLYDEALAAGETLSPGERATLSVNRAVAFRNLGDPVHAEQAYAIAERTYRELGDRPALINVLLNRALVQHLNLDRADRAEPLYEEALALADELGEATQRLQCLDYLGRFLLEEKRFEEAEQRFRDANALAIESGSSEALAASLEGLGRCSLARGDAGGALAQAQRGIEEIESVRGSLEAPALKAAYHEGKRATYSLAVEALAAGGSGADPATARRALGIAQRAKARELLDRLGLEGSHASAIDPDTVASDRVLLEYYVAGERLFGWAVTDSTTRMLDLGPAGEILDEANRMHDLLGRALPVDAFLIRSLADRLIAPFDLPAEIDRWTIAPDRDLDRLPFEMLSDPVDDSRPVVARVDLGYLPNGAMLSRVERAPAARTILGIGDPLPRETGSAARLARRFDLGPLNAATDELASLGRWIDAPVELLVQGDATEEAFGKAYAEGAAVIHVATHTVLDDGVRGSSAILLSAGETSDGLLHPDEIAKLGGASRLTVLAACRSAAAGAEGDTALRGLSGAFLVSGSEAVVATLWDVGDEATRAFMEQFYHGLGRGLASDSALAEAKRAMIADPAWNDPAVWAAYVLIGNPAPVTTGRPPYLAVIVVIAVGGALFLAWRYGRTSNVTR